MYVFILFCNHQPSTEGAENARTGSVPVNYYRAISAVIP
jgi:hypothetical protein